MDEYDYWGPPVEGQRATWTIGTKDAVWDENTELDYCEACGGTGYMASKTLLIECPFGCEEVLPE